MASSEDSEEFIARKKKKAKRDKLEAENRINSGIKLILKVGNSSTSTPERSTDLPDDELSNFYTHEKHKKSKKKKKKKEREHKKKKHHHKEKKKRRKDEFQEDYAALGNEAKESFSSVSAIRIIDESKKIKEPVSQNALRKLLEHIQHAIEKRDPNKFFAWPVTDLIAPGYSLVISDPMDFDTMRRKIDRNMYRSLPEYLSDVKLMCDNAMLYNQPDTVYYKTAKKLLHATRKIASDDKIRSLMSTVPCIKQLTSHQLGFHLMMDSSSDESDTEFKPLDETAPATAETGKSDEEADGILRQAQSAAASAAAMVAKKRPQSKMGYLRQAPDGSTTLAIIVPNSNLQHSKKERTISLGSLIGKLTHGTGNVHTFREDKRNLIKPVKPMQYGAFGSYAPSYDSTFANITKEESQLLLQTYGDESCVQYAESILNFAKDCDYTTTMVDNLLDIMTGGDHRETKRIIEEGKKERNAEMEDVENTITENNNDSKNTKAQSDSKVHNMNQLKTLSEIGIDTSFLDYYQTLESHPECDTAEAYLEQNRLLLQKLHTAQNDRLSATLPTHLALVAPPSDTETSYADKVTENLAQLIKKVPPGSVVSVAGVRKAMGVPLSFSDQLSSQDTQEGSTTEERCHSIGNRNTNNTPGLGLDLESELREFLESDPAFSLTDVDDDRTIEQMLSGDS